MTFTYNQVRSWLYRLICLLVLFIGIQYAYAQEPPLKSTGYFDRSEIILVWDEGSRGVCVCA